MTGPGPAGHSASARHVEALVASVRAGPPALRLLTRSLLAAAAALTSLCGTAIAEGPATTILEVVDAATHPVLRRPRFPERQPALRLVYETVAYEPLWTRDGRLTPQAAAVLAILLHADTRGLDARDYDAERLRAEAARLSGGGATPRDIGLFDAALAVATMRYASDAYLGRIDPRSLGFGLDVEPKTLDLPAEILALACADDPAVRLAALDPPFALFGRLTVALARMRALAAWTDLPAVPALPTLRPGDADPGVPALRTRLAALGDLPETAPAPAAPERYDPALVEAVKRFQQRHGRTRDGVIGKATRADLAVPPADRVAQITLAMERLRWLPRRLSGRFVVVNLPEFRLRGFEDDRPEALVSMEVVVGSAAQRTETPIMHADMRYLIFRPYWIVPASIARHELLPRDERDPGYLARQDMEIVGGRIRQRPGPRNALGLLKFILPNAFHVYLHDTPSKELFARSRRDFSHGCIRVADPVALAEFVLGDAAAGWDRASITEAMTRGKNNRRVDLPEPVPVYLLYTTIVADAEGRVFFFDDIYGHDAALARALAKEYWNPA